MYDEGLYRPGMNACPEPLEHQSSLWSVRHGKELCYAESDDVMTWRKPPWAAKLITVKQVQHRLWAAISSNGMYGASVFKDACLAAERYKLIYMGMAVELDTASWQAQQRAEFWQREGTPEFPKGYEKKS